MQHYLMDIKKTFYGIYSNKFELKTENYELKLLIVSKNFQYDVGRTFLKSMELTKILF